MSDVRVAIGSNGMIESAGHLGSPAVMPQYPYERVTADLRRRILTGEFAPGTKLPSRRELAAEYGVSDIVIGAAMRALRAEGLTEPLPGIGTFVADPLPGGSSTRD